MNSREQLHTAIKDAMLVDLRGAEPTIELICAKADAYDRMKVTMNTIRVISSFPMGNHDFDRIHAIAVEALKMEP